MKSVWIVYVVYDDIGWHRDVEYVCATYDIAIRAAKTLGLLIDNHSHECFGDFGRANNVSRYVDICEKWVNHD